jgi:hypothetical protein
MGRGHTQNRQALEELVSKRALIILAIAALLGTWLFVTGYEFLEKENALWQKKVKTAKEEQLRCMARYTKYRSYDQFRTSIRVPYASDLSMERWLRQYNTLHAGMSESEVEIVMGAPDYARCDLSKEGDKFVGSVWQYVMAVPQDLANEVQNSSIQITYGPDGKVMDKSAMNMQPGPTPTPAFAAATPTPVPVASPEASPSPVAIVPTATPNAVAMPSATPVPQATPAAVATPTSQ